MSEIAPLRPDLTIDEAAGAIVDPALGRRIKLDPRGIEAALALRGATELEGLVAALGTDTDAAERIVASFDRLHLLATPLALEIAADASAARAMAERDASDVPLLIDERDAFECTLCGSCCGGHNIGPVSERTLQGLAGHYDALEAASGSAKGLFFTMPSPPGAAEARRVFCHVERGTCVLLDDAGLCRIHGMVGGDAKPEPCQLFPFELVATPDGIAVSLQMECRDYLEARRGPPLHALEAELRRLVAIAPGLRRVPSPIPAGGGAVLTWSRWKTVSREVGAAVDAVADAEGDPALLAAAHGGLATRLDWPSADSAGSDAAAITAELDALVADLRHVVADLRRATHEDEPDRLVHTTSLDAFADALAVLVPELPRVLRPLPAAGVQLLRDVLRQQLAGHQILFAPDLRAGSARLVFGWLAAKALMLARARRVKRLHLTARDALDAQVVVGFLFRSEGFIPVLERFDDRIGAVFGDGLPGLLALDPAQARRERRVELFRF